MLNIELFDIKMDTDFIGRNFIYLDETDSTNHYLMKEKIKGNGTVAFAEKQNKGKGRKDRVWYSAKDQNLTFSILITDTNFLGEKINLVNFVASLSIALAIENQYQLKTELKWPNDILINGKKIAGILSESVSKGSKIDRLVIGIGLNVNQNFFQGAFHLEPTSLRLELHHVVEREHLLAEILNIFEEHLVRLLDNPDEILNEWRARCRMIGEKISIVEGEDTRYGIFDDIDENGFLLLRSGNITEKIHFGDVSLR